MEVMRVLWAFSLAATVAACSPGSRDPAAAGPPPLPGGFDPVAVDEHATSRDCLWSVTEEMNYLNLFYLEEYANYWIAPLVLPPGGQIRLRGRFPYARYMSFNVYSPTFKPLDVLADVDIEPAPNSVNPFVAGNDRQTKSRDYAVRLLAEHAPGGERAANTLYAEFGASGVAPSLEPLLPQELLDTRVPSNVVILIYRVYLPDTGTSRSGGVDLPDIEIVDAAGNVFQGPDACDFLEPALPTFVNDFMASSESGPVSFGLSVPPSSAASEQPKWYRYFDLLSTYLHHLEAVPGHSGLPELSALDFAYNLNNSYMMSYVSQQFGELVSIRARAPTHRRTVRGDVTVENSQVRYFSFCANDFYSRRVFDCVYDEEIPQRDGTILILVGRDADRPRNATYECGVAWLRWGLFAESTLIYRQMTPGESPLFDEAIRQIPPPSGQNEQAVMGDFYPRVRYESRAAFEALGCPVNGHALE